MNIVLPNNCANPGFTFRAVRSHDEQVEVLRLRYRIYRGCHLHEVIPENAAQIDIDSWDLHSRHYGLFRNDGQGQTLIGTSRVVEDTTQVISPLMLGVLGEYPEFRQSALRDARYPLPSFLWAPEPAHLWKLLNEWRAANENCVEASRIAIDKSCRGLVYICHIFESIVAIHFFGLGATRALGIAKLTFKAFYGRYGFTPIAGLERFPYLHCGKSGTCLAGSPSTVPADVRSHLARLAANYLSLGEIPLVTSPSLPKSEVTELTGEAA